MINVVAQCIGDFRGEDTEAVCILLQEYTLLAVRDWNPMGSGKTTWIQEKQREQSVGSHDCICRREGRDLHEFLFEPDD